MVITINIEKRHAFIILGALLLLIVAGVVYALVPNPGHPAEDFIPSDIVGDLKVSGTINVHGDIIINGLPLSAPHNNLRSILCDIDDRVNC